MLIETLDFVSDRRVTVKFYNTLMKNWTRVKKGLDMDLKICETFNPCQVRFILENDDMNELETNVNSIDPFKIMMEQSKKLQLPLNRVILNRKDLLFNDLIKLLKEQTLGWRGGLHTSVGVQFLNSLTDLLWYIDPHKNKFNTRGCTLPTIFLTLPEYQNDVYYNQFYFSGHHKKQQLSCEKLKLMVKQLESYVNQPWTGQQEWKEFIGFVLNLCHSIRKYVDFMELNNEQVKSNHLSIKPIRNVLDHISIETREYQRNIDKKYCQISEVLYNSEFYEVHFLDNYLPENTKLRYNFINSIECNVSFTIYRYYHGNYLGTLNFIWKVPNHESDRNKTYEVQAIALANEMVPTFFTRQMKKNISEKVSLFYQLFSYL